MIHTIYSIQYIPTFNAQTSYPLTNLFRPQIFSHHFGSRLGSLFSCGSFGSTGSVILLLPIDSFVLLIGGLLSFSSSWIVGVVFISLLALPDILKAGGVLRGLIWALRICIACDADRDRFLIFSIPMENLAYFLVSPYPSEISKLTLLVLIMLVDNFLVLCGCWRGPPYRVGNVREQLIIFRAPEFHARRCIE